MSSSANPEIEYRIITLLILLPIIGIIFYKLLKSNPPEDSIRGSSITQSKNKESIDVNKDPSTNEDPPKPPIIEKTSQRTTTSFRSKKTPTKDNSKTDIDRMFYLSKSDFKPIGYQDDNIKKIPDNVMLKRQLTQNMKKNISHGRPSSPNFSVSEGKDSLKDESVGFEADEEDRIQYENNAESSKRR